MSTSAQEKHLLDQIEKAKARLADLRDRVRLEEYHLELLEAELKELGGTASTSPYRKGLPQGVPLDRPLPEQIVAVFDMLGAGTFLKPREIAARLEEAGVETTSAKGLSPLVIAALHRRTDLFGKVRWGVFELRKKRST